MVAKAEKDAKVAVSVVAATAVVVAIAQNAVSAASAQRVKRVSHVPSKKAASQQKHVSLEPNVRLASHASQGLHVNHVLIVLTYVSRAMRVPLRKRHKP